MKIFDACYLSRSDEKEVDVYFQLINQQVELKKKSASYSEYINLIANFSTHSQKLTIAFFQLRNTLEVFVAFIKMKTGVSLESTFV